MDLRITQQTLINQSLAQIRQQSDALGKALQQASTGKRILSPSDDPVATLALLDSQAQEQRLDTFAGNIREAARTLDFSAAALQEASLVLTQVRRIAVEGADAANDADGRNALALEVDSRLNRLLETVNSQGDGRFVFSGTAVQTTPFAVTARDSSGSALTVTYQGASERAEVAVSQQQTVPTRYTGSEVFQQRQRGPTIYSAGATGAAPGTGTDSATGQGTLVVNAVAQTITLNGGAAVAYLGTETNLQVTGPAGEVVFVNTTGITASGTETLSFTGTYDLFQIVAALRDDLRNTRGLAPVQQGDSIRQRLAELDRVQTGILNVLGQQGGTLQNLQGLEGRVQELKLETQRVATELEGADLSAVVSNLQAQQNQLRLTLAASARLFDVSLLDFIG